MVERNPDYWQPPADASRVTFRFIPKFSARLAALLAEAPWVFLWQRHNLYDVANWIEWTPRADERIWMYETKLAR